MAGILEDPSQLATRIRCIADFKRRSPSSTFALGAVLILALAAMTDGRADVATQSFPVWPARLVTTRPGGDTEIRSITVRPQAGVNLQRALTRGELCLAADADSTNLLQQGFKVVGAVDGLGLDRWRRGSVDGAPYPRTAHSVVWTGEELLVWGGRANFYAATNKGDGAIYNPVTDTWRLMNTNGAPAPRSQMAAVWTGREFIVWGGRGDDETSFNDGARYNPETDTWAKIADCRELEPRQSVTAVWTGNEMIVWGGSSRPSTLALSFDTGARYDPVQDRWTLLPHEGAPSPRTKHTAVWTGKDMIVWGGTHYPSAEYLDSGARFNPRAGRWFPLPHDGAPSARGAHLAEWTGSEMIIWGGVAAKTECFNTGARFNPLTGSWSPLSTDSAPAPRFLMRPDAGIWTGRQLLVFGGYDFNTEFNTLHAWSPAPAMQLFQRAR